MTIFLILAGGAAAIALISWIVAMRLEIAAWRANAAVKAEGALLAAEAQHRAWQTHNPKENDQWP